MNYTNLLIVHSYYRWVVLLVLVIQFLWIWQNKKVNKDYTHKDFRLHLLFTLLIDIQLILGWMLYDHSLIVSSFWKDLAIGIKQRQMRFFGLEHMSMMTLGILLSNIYCIKAYSWIGTKAFNLLWRPYLWIYFILLSSIPWSFSPLTSRPNFR